MEKLTLYGFYENKLSCNFCVYPRSFLVFGETPRITKLTGLLDWCVLLILVGEGQEIYNGENSGLAQWNTAVGKAKNDWSIVCPEKLGEIFTLPVEVEPALDLNQSLRTHTAGDVSTFVNDLIKGDLASAAAKSAGILKDGFDMYYTRDLETALLAIAKSLCSLENVHEVRFLVDGNYAKNYGGADVETPYIEEMEDIPGPYLEE